MAVIAAARKIVLNHLDDLMQNRLPRISEKTGLSLEQIKESLVVLKRLSLTPARRLVDDAPPPIIPDAIVEYDPENDRYVAYLNETRMPNLRINQEYALLSKNKTLDKPGREFLKTNLNNAQWLIDAVQQRKRTLLRVINVVVDAQRDVFEQGIQALRPLPMTLVAEQLGIHVATVSRAVAEKYIQTPRGVLPLRKFFTGGTQNEAGEDVAWDAIKAALKDVVDNEDKAKPLSDEQLVDELKKRGLEIARRTVAKYRDQLKIPPARLRKTFLGPLLAEHADEFLGAKASPDQGDAGVGPDLLVADDDVASVRDGAGNDGRVLAEGAREELRAVGLGPEEGTPRFEGVSFGEASDDRGAIARDQRGVAFGIDARRGGNVEHRCAQEVALIRAMEVRVAAEDGRRGGLTDEDARVVGEVEHGPCGSGLDQICRRVGGPDVSDAGGGDGADD
jgi:hypothetical protein